MLSATVFDTVQPVPVMVDGLKTHEELAGSPEHAKLKLPVKTFWLMVKLYSAVPPAGTEGPVVPFTMGPLYAVGVVVKLGVELVMALAAVPVEVLK